MKKIELKIEEIELLQKLANAYYFGMFQQIGIAKNEDEEYRLRDILFSVEKKI